ncbi:MAG TPA: lipid-binding SYLF domain-containing protein [Gemmata sp.]|nr:lipid-binding SYLF domain-containing protein [Gemmata sp.]
MKRFVLASVILGVAAAPGLALPPSNARTLEHAKEVLDELSSLRIKGIPTKLLAEAEGIAIIPRVVKAGFIFGGRGGHGLVMSRNKDGTWSDPGFVNLGGASVGFQAGIESTDVVLVFRTRKSLDRLLEGKGKVTLGADAAIAAGPIGRMAAAATDARMEAEILSYSRSRGLFAGVSLDGAVINADAKSNAKFRSSPEDMKLADGLKARLAEMSGGKPAASPPLPPVLNPPVPPKP